MIYFDLVYEIIRNISSTDHLRLRELRVRSNDLSSVPAESGSHSLTNHTTRQQRAGIAEYQSQISTLNLKVDELTGALRQVREEKEAEVLEQHKLRDALEKSQTGLSSVELQLVDRTQNVEILKRWRNNKHKSQLEELQQRISKYLQSTDDTSSCE